jgi:hypothetical protein
MLTDDSTDFLLGSRRFTTFEHHLRVIEPVGHFYQ